MPFAWDFFLSIFGIAISVCHIIDIERKAVGGKTFLAGLTFKAHDESVCGKA